MYVNKKLGPDKAMEYMKHRPHSNDWPSILGAITGIVAIAILAYLAH